MLRSAVMSIPRFLATNNCPPADATAADMAHPLHANRHGLPVCPVGHVSRPCERHLLHDVISRRNDAQGTETPGRPAAPTLMDEISRQYIKLQHQVRSELQVRVSAPQGALQGDDIYAAIAQLPAMVGLPVRRHTAATGTAHSGVKVRPGMSWRHRDAEPWGSGGSSNSDVQDERWLCVFGVLIMGCAAPNGSA